MYVVMVSFSDQPVFVPCVDYAAVLLFVKDFPSSVPYKIFKEVEE